MSPGHAELHPQIIILEDALAEGDGLRLCGNQIYGAFVLNLRVDLHAIDATPARWRGDTKVEMVGVTLHSTSAPPGLSGSQPKRCVVSPSEL